MRGFTDCDQNSNFEIIIYYENKTAIFIMAFSLNVVKKLYVAVLQFFFVYKRLIYLRSLINLVPV